MAFKSRSFGREIALQVLYQIEHGRTEIAVAMGSYRPADLIGEAEPWPIGKTSQTAEDTQEGLAFARSLVEGVSQHQEEIDRYLARAAKNWRIERMSAVDRMILRIGAFELLYQPDRPRAVVIDEAVELAKRYGAEQSASFVNGVLDGLPKNQDPATADRTLEFVSADGTSMSAPANRVLEDPTDELETNE